MKRYIFYDKKTGEILHTHQLYKLGSNELQRASDEELNRTVSRMVDVNRVKSIITDIPTQSSLKVSLHVNPKTGKIITTKVPRDFWTKKSKTKETKNIQEDNEGGH